LMCLTHVLSGALLGRLFKGRRGRAFLAGVLSHIPLDMLPHFDSTLGVELSTTALGLALVAWAGGLKSAEFWGAVGGVLPDFEIALKRAGVVGRENLLFPTHRFGFLHGERLSAPLAQIIFWPIALFVLLAPKFTGRRGLRG